MIIWISKDYESNGLCTSTNKLLCIRRWFSIPLQFEKKPKEHFVNTRELRVDQVVNTNRFSQNLLMKYSCLLAILVSQDKSHLHFGGRLFEYAALTEKTANENLTTKYVGWNVFRTGQQIWCHYPTILWLSNYHAAINPLLPWVTKTEFLLTTPIQYQADKLWEFTKIN